MSRAIPVKNRAPAPIQITAEQLLREAKERGLEDVPKAPKQFITDKEELLQYQNAKRKDFEDQIRRNRHHIGIWCRYALWEATLKEFERSRSVFERALSEFLYSLQFLMFYLALLLSYFYRLRLPLIEKDKSISKQSYDYIWNSMLDLRYEQLVFLCIT